MIGTLPQSSLRKFWMLAAAALTGSKWSFMALGNRSKFFPNYFLMCFNKETLTMARTLNVELISRFFSILASASDVLGHQGTFMVLALLLHFVALGVIWFVFLFQRKCAQLVLKKIHLARLFTGEYCFAFPAAGLGCWGFQDASRVWYVAVSGCSGWQWNEAEGLSQATNKCLAWVWMPLPFFDLALTKR